MTRVKVEEQCRRFTEIQNGSSSRRRHESFFECKVLEELKCDELGCDPIVTLLTKPVLDEIDKHKQANGRTRKRALFRQGMASGLQSSARYNSHRAIRGDLAGSLRSRGADGGSDAVLDALYRFGRVVTPPQCSLPGDEARLDRHQRRNRQDAALCPLCSIRCS